MARLHQAASAVKNKVQGTLTNCFSHKHQLVEGDEHDDSVDPPTSSSRDLSDESERSSSLGPSASNLTEYFDADGTGSDIDMTPEEELEEEFEESGGKGGVFEGGHSGGHLDKSILRNGNYLHSGEVVVEKQQQQQDSSQLHTKNHRHYLHHRGALPGDMVQVDEEKVAAMRAILVEDPSLDQKKMESATLMRFLIARNLDLHKAAEMFAQHCKWRDEFVPKGFIVESQIPNQLAAEKTFIQGLDRNGRPLMIVVGCKHLAKERDMEEFKRYAAYCMDKTIASMPEGVDKFCCIFDLENTGLRNFDTSALFVILDFFQAHFPERLAKIYMIHVPYIFWGVWKVASKALLPRTRAKITFLTDDEAYKVLKQEFGEQCLPRKYGGRSEFQLAQDYRLETPVRVFS